MKSSKKSAGTNKAFFLIIAVIAVVGIAALTYVATRPKNNITRVAFDSTLPKVESQGYVMGSPDAPVEMTEFGDFECPQCGRFATLTEPDVRTRLIATGKLRWRYIDYPLDMHKNTWNASIAAACADQQGKFWEMHDAIYGAQDQWDGEATSNPNKVLKELATKVGLNRQQFDDCLDNEKTKPKVQAHYLIAQSRHLPGTPSFILGDKQITEFLSYDDLKKLVDEEAAKAAPAKK